MSLATLVAPLVGRRVCFAYQIVPRSDGRKPDKLPVDIHTGRAINHMDPATWHTPEEVISAGWPVAIMLHEALNMFCLDLDEAWICHECQKLSTECQCGNTTKHGWSPFAQGICAAFPGAAIEISVSGRGLHVLACADLSRVPAHRTSSDAVPGLEIYTRNRFIALTGNGLVGDIRVDHTAMLQAAIAHYLPGEPGTAVASGWWTTGPQWQNKWTHLSDEDLIRCMIAGRPGAGPTFNGTAGIRELWVCDQQSLIDTFPTNQPGKEWDFNRADQALATHIAFYTAADCERTRRILMMSALRRDKWEREDYMYRTITRACRTKLDQHARKVQSDAAGAQGSQGVATVDANMQPSATAAVLSTQGVMLESGTVTAAVPPPPLAMDQAIDQRKPPGTWMTVNDQWQLFDGVTYVMDIHSAMTRDGRLINSQRFDVEYGGYEFQMSVDGSAVTKSAWECFTQSRCVQFPRVSGLYFDPKDPPGHHKVRDKLTFVNTWQPIDIPCVQGDVTPFLQHMANLFPVERDRMIMLSYMACVVKYKGYKTNWVPLIVGCPGNGKTWLSKCIEYCIGRRYTHWPNTQELGNHFNEAFNGKLLLIVDDIEISEAQGSMWQAMLPMIGNEQLSITPKGVDSATRDVCFNLMFLSNKKNAVRKTRDDRRIAPFFCPQQHEYDLIRYGMHEDHGDYFINLRGWANAGGFAHIYWYLLNFDIPEQFHPLGKARRAPKTSATESAIRASLGIVEQEILESIEAGIPGFRNGWISSIAIDVLLERLGKRNISRNKREDMITELGYKVHPDLPTGRVWLKDGTRPTLYVTRAGHPTEGIGLTFDQIGDAFMQSQR